MIRSKSLSITKAISVIVIGVALAGGVFAFRYARGRLPAPSTWRSLDHPVPDTSAEEYAVYSAILDKIHYEDRLRVFVIRDHTAPCVRMDEWCTDKQVRDRLPKLQSETLADYVSQNRESAKLSESFKPQRPAVLLSDRELPELLIKTKVKVNFSPLPARKIEWGEFYRRYPLSPGLISLSRVGFDSEMKQALVYEELSEYSDGTWGRYLVLTKQSGRWVIEDQIRSYFPEEPRASVKQSEFGLKGRVLDARAEGLDEVEMISLSCGWNPRSLREALDRATVVVAEVENKQTFAGHHNLHTWYRFRIVETLSEKPMPQYPNEASLPDSPEEMRPLNKDEFVILEANGQMEIDGVRVIHRSNGVVYTVGGTYLLFLHIAPSKRVATRAGTDPLAVFLVAKDGTFRSYIDRPYPLRDQLARRFGNSIEKLRTALKTNPAKL